MRPDLVEGAQELRDLLGEGRRLFELALTEVLVRERLLDALDHLVGLGRGVEGALGPTAAHHQAHCCRRIADKTPRHGSTRLSTARHQAQAEPRTMQHNHTRATTDGDAFLRFPKPGVGCSIQPGGTTSCLHRAISPVTIWAVRPGIGPNADT